MLKTNPPPGAKTSRRSCTVAVHVGGELRVARLEVPPVHRRRHEASAIEAEIVAEPADIRDIGDRAAHLVECGEAIVRLPGPLRGKNAG